MEKIYYHELRQMIKDYLKQENKENPDKVAIELLIPGIALMCAEIRAEAKEKVVVGAVEILHDRYIKNDPERRVSLEVERVKLGEEEQEKQ